MQESQETRDPWVGKIPWSRTATHPSILAWKTLWTEEPGGLQSIGSQRATHTHIMMSRLTSISATIPGMSYIFENLLSRLKGSQFLRGIST